VLINARARLRADPFAPVDDLIASPASSDAA